MAVVARINVPALTLKADMPKGMLGARYDGFAEDLPQGHATGEEATPVIGGVRVAGHVEASTIAGQKKAP
ncbi:hypothetical protein [Sphingobium sp. C100]|uniref:hypothetical protein n=1 Tax=Sphingobium sp. C100 TaxID=1207055 RepID=UPI001F2AB5C7|nr:hypothetical protein [Sphingobium sp. C100]